jgi:hypothetical protein
MIIAGSGGQFNNSPVDSNRFAGRWQRLWRGIHYERCVPVAETVAVDPHTRRLTGKLPGPDWPHANSFCQKQIRAVEAKSAASVVQSGQRPTFQLEPGHTRPFAYRKPGAHVFERLGPRLPEVTDSLLLWHRGTRPEPLVFRSPASQHHVEHRRAAVAVDAVGITGLRDRLIPYPPAAVPLGEQSLLGRSRHTQTVRISSKPSHTQPPDTGHTNRRLRQCRNVCIDRTLTANRHVPPCPAGRGSTLRSLL